jgi:predicted ATPase
MRPSYPDGHPSEHRVHLLKDFKGFELASLDLFRPLTLLIGRNGSGKSNLIEGLELLAVIAGGSPLHEISDVGRGGSALEFRGGLQACARQGTDRFSLGFRAATRFEGSVQDFIYEVTIRAEPFPRVVVEKLEAVGEGRPIFSAEESASADLLEVEYDDFERGPNKPRATVASNRSVLSQYSAMAVKNKKLSECTELVQALQGYLRRSFVFDPSPKLMRSYERIGNRTLTRDGANLSAVLHALSEGSPQERASLARILKWAQQIPEEPYSDFGFVTTSLHDVIFGLKRSPDGELIDARLLSDGTLRILAVLTALETADPSSRVVIEEIDNGLHPSRVRILTAAIEEACERRELNVLVTTHNPATLDALSSSQLEGVTICYWDPGKNAARLVRLSEVPRADEMLERAPLGDLVTRRVLEQYLAPRLEEDRRAQLDAWLKQLP